MASELDDYLKDASPKQKDQLEEIRSKMQKAGVQPEEENDILQHATPNDKQYQRYGGPYEGGRTKAELKDIPQSEVPKNDSLSAYDNSKQSQQPSPLQKENESEIDR